MLLEERGNKNFISSIFDAFNISTQLNQAASFIFTQMANVTSANHSRVNSPHKK